MNKQEAINSLKNIIEYWSYKPTEVEAAKLAISALEQQLADRWIPVTQRLPENKVRVLITKATGTVSVGFCNVNYNEWREEGYIINPNPIAWKPLPQPHIGN